MHTHHPIPGKEQIALLEPFERLGLDRIHQVTTGAQAERACAALAAARFWGFDTESRPTFAKGQESEGPHIVQLATLDAAWVFQLHDPDCSDLVAELLTRPGVTKAGFGLGDDTIGIDGRIDQLGSYVHALNCDGVVGEEHLHWRYRNALTNCDRRK